MKRAAKLVRDGMHLANYTMSELDENFLDKKGEEKLDFGGFLRGKVESYMNPSPCLYASETDQEIATKFGDELERYAEGIDFALDTYKRNQALKQK